MKKAVLLITIVLLGITGCSQKSSVMEQLTAVETTVTISETKATEADIYGNLGEDFFNQNVIKNWKNYTITDEKALREDMDVVYGNLSTKEELIQIVLDTPRDNRYGDLGKEFFEANIIANWKNYNIPNEQKLRERIDTIYENLSTKEDLVQEALATPRDAQPTQPTQIQAAETTQQSNNNNGGVRNITKGNKETKATATTKETKSNNNGSDTATQAPSVDPEKKAQVDAKIKEWENTPGHVDDSGGAGGINEGAEDAAKGWQWQ